MKYPVVSFGLSMGLASLWAAYLLMLRVVFLLHWRTSMVCFALEFVGSWVEIGFSVGMETLGGLLSINVLWSQEFSDVLWFWS